MVDQKAEPIAASVQDGQPASSPSMTAEAQNDNHELPNSDARQVSVREDILDAVVSQQAERISQLERLVEKKRAKFEQLSAKPPILHPPGLCVVPPGHSGPGTSAKAQNITQATQTAANSVLNQNTNGHAQRQPVNHPVMAAAMAAAAITGNPHASGALPTHYPFMFGPPDHVPAASLMSVMPHGPNALPAQRPQPQNSLQTPQSMQRSERERKQSRYWTPDEHQRFLAAVNTCGPKNYNQISEFVGTRNPKQVRTHAQKFQQKLERDEAKRRGETQLPAGDGSGSTVGVAAAAVVAAAAAAAMNGNVPGAIPSAIQQDSLGAYGGPSSSSSGKNFPHSDNPDQPNGGTSGDGSSSTNDLSGSGSRLGNGFTNRNPVSDSESPGDHGTSNAAAAAIAAEAAALGGGILRGGSFGDGRVKREAVVISSSQIGSTPPRKALTSSTKKEMKGLQLEQRSMSKDMPKTNGLGGTEVTHASAASPSSPIIRGDNEFAVTKQTATKQNSFKDEHTSEAKATPNVKVNGYGECKEEEERNSPSDPERSQVRVKDPVETRAPEKDSVDPNRRTSHISEEKSGQHSSNQSQKKGINSECPPTNTSGQETAAELTEVKAKETIAQKPSSSPNVTAELSEARGQATTASSEPTIMGNKSDTVREKCDRTSEMVKMVSPDGSHGPARAGVRKNRNPVDGDEMVTSQPNSEQRSEDAVAKSASHQDDKTSGDSRFGEAKWSCDQHARAGGDQLSGVDITKDTKFSASCEEQYLKDGVVQKLEVKEKSKCDEAGVPKSSEDLGVSANTSIRDKKQAGGENDGTEVWNKKEKDRTDAEGTKVMRCGVTLNSLRNAGKKRGAEEMASKDGDKLHEQETEVSKRARKGKEV